MRLRRCSIIFEIDSLPVVAFSAGSSSAVQLALRHAERVSRLVLISPNSPHPQPLPEAAAAAGADPVQPARVLGDAAAHPLAPGGHVGDTARVRARRARARDTARDHRQPVPGRASRTRDDLRQLHRQPRHRAAIRSSRSRCPRSSSPPRTTRWRRIRTHGRWLSSIPGARFVSVPRGGHALTQLDPGLARPSPSSSPLRPRMPRSRAPRPPKEHRREGHHPARPDESLARLDAALRWHTGGGGRAHSRPRYIC